MTVRSWSMLVLYVPAFLGLDAVSHVQPVLVPEMAPWNPEAALTLLVLRSFGCRALPAVAVASMSAALIKGIHAPLPLIVASSVWVSLASGLLAAALERSSVSSMPASVGEAARFASICALGTLVIALGFVGLFAANGSVPLTDAARGVARRWLADLNGILILAPLLTRWRDAQTSMQQVRARGHELALQFVALISMLWIVLSLPVDDQLRFFYLLFVPLIWTALRWSWTGALLSCLVVQIALLVAAKAEIDTPRFIDLQFLMLTLTLTGLLLGAVVAERARVLQRIALREMEQRILLAMAPDAVLATDSSGVITMANRAAERMFLPRASSLIGIAITVLLPELVLSSTGKAALEGRRNDVDRFPAEVAWSHLESPANPGFLVTIRDATERHLAEEQLRERDIAMSRAMRFALAGELASALTHELNQPITALVSYLNAAAILAEPSRGVDARLHGTLEKATCEAIRASNVLQRLRNFYQTGELKRDMISVAALLSSVATAFQDRLRRAGVVLELQCEPAIPEIRGDHTQIEIVVHNLLANAIDALAASGAQARCVTLSAGRQDESLVIHIEDSGPGVNGQGVLLLFEPFVTTKPDGMGLGLAISRTLVRARGGELTYCRSRKLHGACFTIRLPIVDPQARG